MSEPNDPNDPEKKNITAQHKKDTADLMGLLDELDNIIIPQLKTAEKKQSETGSDSTQTSTPAIESPNMEQPQTPQEASQATSPPIAPTLPQSPINLESAVPQSENVSQPIISAPAPDAASEAPKPALATIPADFLETEVATGRFFVDMQIFFKQLGRANAQRFELWESTLSTILKILRKMQQNQQQNTELLIQAIERLHMKIKKGLQEFLVKRDEVERFSDTDFKQMAKSLKKTLELLNFQIREFKMQQTVSELYDIYVNS